MIHKLLDRIPDPALNKKARPYNVFCVMLLAPYLVGRMVVAVGHALGWKWTGSWVTFAQLAWVLLWLPNLRADRGSGQTATIGRRPGSVSGCLKLTANFSPPTPRAWPG